MVSQGMTPGLGNPPSSFDSEFFEWLQMAGNELEVSFATFRPLASDARDWLSAEVSGSLPPDVAAFYDHCDPWGLLNPDRPTWKRISESVQSRCGGELPLLPIDVGGVQGHYIVARISPDAVEIIEVSTRENDHRTFRIGLRAYLVGLVEHEARADLQPA